jgi:hypothetical protein
VCSSPEPGGAARTPSGPALNPACDGPDPVYAIAMDVGTDDVRDDPVKRNLLLQLGDLPGRHRPFDPETHHHNGLTCTPNWQAIDQILTDFLLSLYVAFVSAPSGCLREDSKKGIGHGHSRVTE